MALTSTESEQKRAELSLAFLGAPTVRRAGRDVAFRTRKALALLVYLSVEGGVHTRDELVALFWPESDQGKGRASLRTTLSYLRRALRGPATDDDQAKDGGFLAIDRDTLRFNPEAGVHADWLTLQNAWAAARAPVRLPGQTQADPEEDRLAPQMLLAQLQQAASLYRGDFLTGFSLGNAPAFDDWASIQREQCHRQIALIFDRLSQLQFEGGELRDAIETASRWVALDSLNEVAYRRLMQLHLAAVDRSAALRAYEACQSVLARELNADPSPETEALADRIRDFPGKRVRSGMSGLESGDMASRHLPLVGRAGEHLALVTAFRAMRRGQPQIIILEGEPGIGKTRLALNFLAWAQAQGALTLQGRAFESSGRLPYQAMVEALRDRLDEENAPEDLLADLWLAELSRLFPELRQRYSDLSAPPTPEAATQTRLFEAVTRLCQAWAERAPTVLLLDDLQWTDSETLDLLHYACRRWVAAGAPVLLLCTLRPKEVEPESESQSNAKVRDWIVSLQREMPMARFPLQPLLQEDVARLVRDFAEQLSEEQAKTSAEARTRPQSSPDAALLEQFARQLFAETGGQPFFLVERLKALLEVDRMPSFPAHSDSLRGREAPAVDLDAVMHRYLISEEGRQIPETVQEMIGARLARLRPSAQLACLAAAVLGDTFDFERLRGVSGLSESEGLAALDELVQRGLIREQRRAVKRPYVMAHDHFRRVVYDQASMARRRVLHGRALNVLEADGAPAAELAQHAWAAGLFEQSLALDLAAGKEAMSLYAPQTALDHFCRALQAAEQSSTSPPPDLYLARGHVYETTGNFEGAHQDFYLALQEAQKCDDSQGQWRALQNLGFLWASRDQVQAGDYFRQALSLAEKSSEPAMLARSLNRIGNWLANVGRPGEALRLHQRALNLFEELEHRSGQADTLDLLGMASYLAGDMRQSQTHYRQAVDHFRALDRRRGLVSGLAMMSLAMRATFTAEVAPDTDLTQCVPLTEEALKAAREIGWRAGESHALLALGQHLCHTGRYGPALACAQQGLALATDIEHFLWMTYGHWLLGLIHLDLLEFAQAQKYVERALDMARETASVFWLRITGALLALTYTAQRKSEESGALLTETLGARDDSLHTVAWREQTAAQRLLWYARAELALACREPDVALQIVENLVSSAKNVGDRQPSLRLAKLRGQSLAALGRSKEAEESLQLALRLATEQCEPPLHWRTHLALAHLYEKEQQNTDAGAQLSAARAIVEELAQGLDDATLRLRFRRKATKLLGAT